MVILFLLRFPLGVHFPFSPSDFVEYNGEHVRFRSSSLSMLLMRLYLHKSLTPKLQI